MQLFILTAALWPKEEGDNQRESRERAAAPGAAKVPGSGKRGASWAFVRGGRTNQSM